MTGLSPERQAGCCSTSPAPTRSAARSAKPSTALLDAEEHRPEQVRSHDLARQLVSDLLTMQNSPSDELLSLAEHLTV